LLNLRYRLRLTVCGKNPLPRQYARRWQQLKRHGKTNT